MHNIRKVLEELDISDVILPRTHIDVRVVFDDSDNSTLSDSIADPSSNPEKWIDNVSIKDALKVLEPREKRILIMRYYLGKTQVEVSDEIGISQAQVSRLEKNALDVVKKFLV